MFLKRKTMFDIIREADDEEQSQEDTNTDQNAADAPDESGEEANNEDEDNNSDDEDFNIDTNLDDSEDDNQDDSGATDDNNDTNTSSDIGGQGDEEPVQANTDIFASLSAEEQQIKIMELKKLFQELYTSTDDILEKINSIDVTEQNLEVINRISTSLYSLRKYISDYIIKSFPFKSYIENDITFNRFLTILNSITTIINELGNEIEKDDKK